MNETMWLQYADQVEGNLRNILSASVIGYTENPDSAEVLHSVKKDTKAYLQKGVYCIEYPDTEVASREVYYSALGASLRGSQSNGSYVAYYITVYNPSSAYLYLTEIQDLAPEGFTLLGIAGGKKSYTTDVNSMSLYAYTDPDNPVAVIDAANVNWITTDVAASIEDGVITYKFGQYPNSKCDLKYDSSVGYYYLAQYDAISFIAIFEPGTDDETEVYATNTIAMPYVNVSGDELQAANVEGTSNATTTARQNVGGCEIIGESEALANGFQSVEISIADANTDQWLTSDVTVQRGEIIPGIKKTVDETAENGVDVDDTVTWTIEVTNDGTVPMVNYTITDILDYPYQISGDITIVIYDKNGDPIMQTYGDTPFLKITDRSDTSFLCTCYWGEYYGNNRYNLYTDYVTGTYGVMMYGQNLTTNFVYKYASYETWDSNDVNVDYKLTIDIDKETGNDVFTLVLTDLIFVIPAGGKLVLTIDTEPSTTPANGIYYNEATVTPVQSYNDDAVTSGQAVSAADSSSGEPYVHSSDYVFVNGGYSTSSQKWIQSNKTTSKTANSEQDNSNDVRYIVLDNEEETFRYTLEVTNKLNDIAMEKLVIVDVLPESGDYAPFTVKNSSTARYSEFQVDLLLNDSGGDDTVEWEVVIGTKQTVSGKLGDYAASETITGTTQLTRVYPDNGVITADSGYVIYYSTCSDFTGEGMTTSKYAGLDATYEDGSYVWTTDPTSARSIRIEILDDIPAGSAVQISFNAKVSDDSEDIAEPGEIAWNSFAYRYSTMSISQNARTGSGTTTETLWAAPRKVGVMIPDVPKLQKTLSNIDEDKTAIANAQVFRFLVHEGNQLTTQVGDEPVLIDYTAYTEDELIAALDLADKEYFVITLTVPANSTSSEAIDLDPEKAETPNYNFVYKAGENYTIVELPNGSDQAGNNLFAINYMYVDEDYVNEDEDSRVDTNVLTFIYTSGSDYILITANNVYSEEEGGYELPLTGGAGTLVHTTAGLLLSGGAACLMYKKKKRKGGCAS